MSAVTRRTDSLAPIAVMLFLALALLGLVSVWTIAGWWSGSSTGFVDPVEEIRAGAPWADAHTAAAVLIGVLLVAIAAAVITVTLRQRRDRLPADRAAAKMGTGRAIAPLLPAAVRQRHQRMGIAPGFLGVTVGHTINGRVPLRASYEHTDCVGAGPRRNKSESIVIPHILSAPGTVLATSVKPDILADTLAVRAEAGTVHIFDPQRLASAYTSYDCWWNPLAAVRTIEDTDKLAAVFAAATYGADGDKDAFFSQTGRTLLSRYLFAAAIAGEYLPTVSAWLGR